MRKHAGLKRLRKIARRRAVAATRRLRVLPSHLFVRVHHKRTHDALPNTNIVAYCTEKGSVRHPLVEKGNEYLLGGRRDNGGTCTTLASMRNPHQQEALGEHVTYPSGDEAKVSGMMGFSLACPQPTHTASHLVRRAISIINSTFA